jgi:hypothetical protein
MLKQIIKDKIETKADIDERIDEMLELMNFF